MIRARHVGSVIGLFAMVIAGRGGCGKKAPAADAGAAAARRRRRAATAAAAAAAAAARGRARSPRR